MVNVKLNFIYVLYVIHFLWICKYEISTVTRPVSKLFFKNTMLVPSSQYSQVASNYKTISYFSLGSPSLTCPPRSNIKVSFSYILFWLKELYNRKGMDIGVGQTQLWNQIFCLLDMWPCRRFSFPDSPFPHEIIKIGIIA